MAESSNPRGPFACTIYHSAGIDPATFVGPESAAHWRPAEELFDSSARQDGAAVLVVDKTLIPRLSGLRRLPRQAIFVAADAASAEAVDRRIHVSVADVKDPVHRAQVLRAVCSAACVRAIAVRRHHQLTTANRQLRDLNQIGIELMHEHDRGALLRRIVEMGKRMTQSDAGIMLLADPSTDPVQLQVRHWRIDTLPDFDWADDTIAVDDASIIGHAAKTKQPIVVEDAHALPHGVGFRMDPEFDQKYRYRRRSMLIVPMIDHAEELVGVLVFVNRKTSPRAMITSKEAADQFVVPYTDSEVRVARSLASQAAVLIENANLYARIEQNLEDFAKAAVTAIDQRDPTTAGHSLRAAALATSVARAIERADTGPYKDVTFTPGELRELRFAALLHDFGKVAVHESVLLKAKKLPPVLWERVNARFDLIRRTMELDHYKKCPHADLVALDARLDELTRLRAIIDTANQPTVLDAAPAAALREIASRTFEGPDGRPMPYLTADELHYLEIPQGSLDERERTEMEAHAEESYQFLVKIPWTEDLTNVPGFAYAHHEKLDGSGYPRHLTGDQIALQTRIITIVDMFDALTASDRAYKPSVSVDEALSVLADHANAGRLDAELVRIMIEQKDNLDIAAADWSNARP